MRRDGRVRVKLIISLLPGVHLRELQRLLGMSFNSTRYHVDRLAKTGEIVRVEDGGYSRIYTAGISDAEKPLFALVRSDTVWKSLESLSSNSQLSHKQLTNLTGMAKSTKTKTLAATAGLRTEAIGK